MSKYYIDSDRLEQDSLLMKEYISKIDQLLTSYVSKIQRVPTQTKEWEGNSAERFAELVKNEYVNDFVPLLSNLRKYSNELNDAGKEFTVITREQVDETTIR